MRSSIQYERASIILQGSAMELEKLVTILTSPNAYTILIKEPTLKSYFTPKSSRQIGTGSKAAFCQVAKHQCLPPLGGSGVIKEIVIIFAF